jgi:segregation and condensation protein A
MRYQVRLQAFEGPMDLLLHLIDQNQVDIYDIPIALITEQYLDYLEAAPDEDIANLADFLVMAATLLHIKARMLFPRRPPRDAAVTAAEREEDPRAELVQRLLEYQAVKAAARRLEALEQGAALRVYYRECSELPESPDWPLRASVQELCRAFRSVWRRRQEARPGEDVVPRGDVDVAAKMNELVLMVGEHPRGMPFSAVFATAATRREALAFFLALLELIRAGRVRAVQQHLRGEIRVSLVRRNIPC